MSNELDTGIDFAEVAASDDLRSNGLIKDSLWETATAEGAVRRLLDHAFDLQVSDLFFASGWDHVAVTARRLGAILPVTRLPLDFGRRCMQHIRTMGGLRVDGRRSVLDGRWLHINPQTGMAADLRLNSIPTLYGETLGIRLLTRNSDLQKLDALGFVGPQPELIESLFVRTSGLVLVVGPSGSGKTTTLYAFLHALNNGKRKIHSIEDPIEYAVPGLHQSQVDEVHGPTSAELLQAILRQSPDVIMVGEVRSPTTAEIVVRAANSGNLVFATVHAAVAVKSIQSILSLGVAPYFLASSLIAVIGQRLMRRLSPEHRVPVDLSDTPATFAEVRQWLEEGEGQIVYGSPDGGSYAGQTGAFEILTISATLRNMIREQKPFEAIFEQARREGMLDLRAAALLKVAKGETTFDEFVRVIPTNDEWDA
jgi:type II secretory ATPase GspE/PulE/Tfp pilus assembly ATPase PilB-like protein